MQYIDNPFNSNVHLMSPEHAYMAGKIKTNSLDDLRNFERAFPFNPATVVETFKELAIEFPDRDKPPTDQDKLNYAFLKLLPRCYSPKSVGDWEAVLHFTISDLGATYTITVDGTTAKTAAGLVGTPTATIEMDYATYRSVVRYEVIEDSQETTAQKLAEWESQEESADVELSDDQLEAVAGGKGDDGGCGAEAGVAQVCGADACGAAAGAGNACGAAACGAAASAGTACGAAACGAAAGAAGACAADMCGAAAGVATACGVAACSVAACAAAACGADAGWGACAGNACGANANSLVDVGPCAVNVIPCCPFI